jgi:DNA-binding GntR family transcriptional regulator
MSSHSKPADTSYERTLSERAYRLLRGDILAGRLPPGEKLRLQSLQERYGLGISPIREALMSLSNERLAVNEGQRGFSVAEVSEDDLIDIVKARRHIEAILLKESIENGDDEWGADITAAYYLLERISLPTDPGDDASIERFEVAHRKFHQAMLSAAKSPWLQRIDEQLVAHSERYRRIRLLHMKGVQRASPYEKREDGNVVAAHANLMQAVLAKDLPRALALLDEHISDTARIVTEYLGYDATVANAGASADLAPAQPKRAAARKRSAAA